MKNIKLLVSGILMLFALATAAQSSAKITLTDNYGGYKYFKFSIKLDIPATGIEPSSDPFDDSDKEMTRKKVIIELPEGSSIQDVGIMDIYENRNIPFTHNSANRTFLYDEQWEAAYYSTELVPNSENPLVKKIFTFTVANWKHNWGQDK